MSNAADVLEPVASRELLGYTLDLGRPELAEVMERYVPRNPRAPEAMLGPPTAVIVTRWEGQEEALKAELESDGWSVELCEGPGKKACPLMRGESCPMRQRADAAVVFMSATEGCASTPRLRCAADPSSPGVVAIEGRINSPRFSGRTATVGAWRGPEAITSTVSALLAAE